MSAPGLLERIKLLPSERGQTFPSSAFEWIISSLNTGVVQEQRDNVRKEEQVEERD